MLAEDTLERIGSIVAGSNPELTVITDDVYGTFVNGSSGAAVARPRFIRTRWCAAATS